MIASERLAACPVGTGRVAEPPETMARKDDVEAVWAMGGKERA